MKTYAQILSEVAADQAVTDEILGEEIISIDGDLTEGKDGDDEDNLDDLNKSDLKKDHDELKDGDIDNDGDEDDSDEYLHKRRKAISKAVKNRNEAVEAGTLKLTDGALIKVSEDDAKAINKLFAGISEKNREKMMDTMFQNQEGFDELVAMAKDV